MLFSTRKFTATLGGKNSLTREKVFPNVAVNKGQLRLLKKVLHIQAQTEAVFGIFQLEA